MKRCPKCEITKEEALFGNNKSRKDGLQSYCKICIKEADRICHQRYRLKNKAKIKQKGKEIKKYIYQLKERSACKDCGKFYHPFVMEFDHLRDKYKDVSTMLQGRHSLNRVLKEIAKCRFSLCQLS